MANGTAAGRVSAASRAPWRGALRRHLAWLLAVKFALLALLWALFFSSTHRAAVDARSAGQHLAPAAQAAPHD
ncbi:MAG TPA: hypothetical protein VKQ31_12680 [Steroidobacteraceae bacterium]|nr:hypothetical protein [Steroidobacteraceae bacterium]